MSRFWKRVSSKLSCFISLELNTRRGATPWKMFEVDHHCNIQIYQDTRTTGFNGLVHRTRTSNKGEKKLCRRQNKWGAKRNQIQDYLLPIGVHVYRYIYTQIYKRAHSYTHILLKTNVTVSDVSAIYNAGTCRTERGFWYHISRFNTFSSLLDPCQLWTYLDPRDTCACLNPCHVCTCLDPTIIHHARLLYAWDGNRAKKIVCARRQYGQPQRAPW